MEMQSCKEMVANNDLLNDLGLVVCGCATGGDKPEHITFFIKKPYNVLVQDALVLCKNLFSTSTDGSEFYFYQLNIAVTPVEMIRVQLHNVVPTSHVSCAPQYFLLISTFERATIPTLMWSFSRSMPFVEAVPTFTFFVEVQVPRHAVALQLFPIVVSLFTRLVVCVCSQGVLCRYLDNFRYVVVYCKHWLPKIRQTDGFYFDLCH
jgi:hypothetical protein